ncbi:MAG TPA: HK97 family phage prohead protease [Amaricoccus sp.]|uniref:HK97 family phage prohead protease n=1 Tax=Amaricoccus sp. TaxID=1872485 RepID=UPI002BF81DB0|nr:HK97 family phage prohead protease [Amaricoccus sp.]HMQ95255.1 HK97 family phage prohead protease [Amaricoccus sp.]HMR52442.1 HK97 family phage prohead protease [Amaricoccus sp.]HMR61405.1 HK97 family phage prohead protease [Amaricoccus sp.]HMT99402.1 HK97 family phage prohead protease [Amaricoccus sp.]
MAPALLWGGAGGGLELRAAEDGSARLSGRFPYETETDLGPRRWEKIGGRAFRARIEAGEEIHLLLGHDFNRPLASTRAGSLRLEDRDDALVFEATLDPAVADSTTGRDALAMVHGRLATGVSPGFVVTSDEVLKLNRGLLRVVRSAELHELSVVTRPAYASAQVAARSWEITRTIPHRPRRGRGRWRA